MDPNCTDYVKSIKNYLTNFYTATVDKIKEFCNPQTQPDSVAANNVSTTDTTQQPTIRDNQKIPLDLINEVLADIPPEVMFTVHIKNITIV